MKTTTAQPPAPQWLIVDAEGRNLGRLATRIAEVLRGKHRPEFSQHRLYGDHVIVVNAEKLSFPQTKFRRKQYARHTGYTGHLRVTSLAEMMRKRPETVMEQAVKGMLPKNKLREQALKRLHVFAGPDHPHEAQQPQSLPL